MHRIRQTCGVRYAHAKPPDPPTSNLFSFLFGRKRNPRKSHLLGSDGRTALFKPGAPSGGIIAPMARKAVTEKTPEEEKFISSDTTADQSDMAQTAPAEDGTESQRTGRFPAWKDWKNWKKVTLDVYIRLVDRPRDTRIRVKQTLAILPMLKVKPVIDFGFGGPDRPGLGMHLDVKMLDCVKYRVRMDGSSLVQVRVRGPMRDPRFMMDVVYERELGRGAKERVKMSLRMLDVGFFKMPGLGAGVKVPVRFNGGVKGTLRVKKFFKVGDDDGTVLSREVGKRGEGYYGVGRVGNRKPMFGISGPTGVDIKLRCLEYR